MQPNAAQTRAGNAQSGTHVTTADAIAQLKANGWEFVSVGGRVLR